MTKELYNSLNDNVCIPKGANRHPYANVLHEWIEGAEIQVKLDGNWTDYNCSRSYIDKFEYRIKPSEPTYKYQFAYLPMGSIQYEISEYMTEEEAEEKFRLIPCEKIESTKKEKK